MHGSQDLAGHSQSGPPPPDPTHTSSLSQNLPKNDQPHPSRVWPEIQSPSKNGENLSDPQVCAEIQQQYGLSSVAAQIYANRGFKPGKRLEDFVNPALNKLKSPWDLKNMERAVNVLCESIEQGKKIVRKSDGGELVIHGLNGKIRDKNTYDKKDPYPPAG